MKLFYVSLGCPKNSIDLETILGHLSGSIDYVDRPEQADVVLVNTCAFINAAKQESIETILELAAYKKEKPELKVLVAGCLPQRYRDELAQEMVEVDAFFNHRDAQRTAAQVRDYLACNNAASNKRHRLTPRHYAYLRIADGCDNRCTYCAIPLIKGGYHSRPLPEIVAEAEELVRDGARELLLVAQDTTQYGTDLQAQQRLHHVLQALQQVRDVRWIRLLYTHPAHWYPELIETVAGLEKVVPYVDLPIQHISSRVIKAMGRKTDRRHIERLIEELRNKIPDLAIRTTLIVGFPGESESDFAELRQFVAATAFERLGVFTYSQEENTVAGGWEDAIPEAVKQARQAELMEIQADISCERNQAMIGRQFEVVVDEIGEEGHAIARSRWDAPEIDNTVILDSRAQTGAFALVTCTAADIYDLRAHIDKIV